MNEKIEKSRSRDLCKQHNIAGHSNPTGRAKEAALALGPNCLPEMKQSLPNNSARLRMPSEQWLHFDIMGGDSKQDGQDHLRTR